MEATKPLRRTRLRSIEKINEERHASWLELFFDLVFVVAVSQVAKQLYNEPTGIGFVKFVVLFATVWWAWIGYSFYADRFESNEIVYRLLTFAGMLAVAALSVNISYTFDTDGNGGRAFIISYVVVRLILIAMYIRAAVRVPLARDLCVRYIEGFSLGLLFWLVSAFVDAPLKYVLWAAGILVEMVTPLMSTSLVRRTPYDTAHMPERFGLFTLIVLGESVLAVVGGVAGASWRVSSALLAGMGFAIAVCVWWIYYDFVETCAMRSVRTGQVYLFGHFPIVAGVAASGVGIHLAILEAGNATLSAGVRWTVCGGVGVFLLATMAIRLASGRRTLWWARVSTGGFALLLGLVGESFAPLVFVGILLSVLIAEVALEVVRDGQPEESCAEGEGKMQQVDCAHMRQVQDADVVPSAEGCEECLQMGDSWVHLRLCLSCGHVGCCDNSKNKHATKHFNQTTHPVIESFEPDEDWRWCYVDELYAEPQQ